jgi:hypothetical protein
MVYTVLHNASVNFEFMYDEGPCNKPINHSNRLFSSNQRVGSLPAVIHSCGGRELNIICGQDEHLGQLAGGTQARRQRPRFNQYVTLMFAGMGGWAVN